jgi:hypothetical protein
MTPIEDFTDEDLAGYQLRWIPMLAYDGVPLAGVELELVIEALEEGASQDSVVLFLHEMMDSYDDEDRDLRTWQKLHPIRHILSRAGWHLQVRNGYRTRADGMRRASTTERGYGTAHQRERQRWAPHVNAGQVRCARCGKPIIPAHHGTSDTTTLGQPGPDPNTHDATERLAPDAATANAASDRADRPRPRASPRADGEPEFFLCAASPDSGVIRLSLPSRVTPLPDL